MALNNPYALSFDGVDDRVVIPNFYNTAEMTVMAHVVFAEWPTFGWIINKRDNFNDNQWQLCCYDGRIEAGIYSGGNTNIGVVGYEDIVVGQVYNVCFVTSGVNGGFLRLFIDGIEVGSTTLVGNMKLGSREIVIGMAGWDRYPFKGEIDNIAIFNKVLTWEEIDAYKNKYLQGNEPGLAALYRFDDGSGSIVTDSSPNANHGTIYGATWIPGKIDLTPSSLDITLTAKAKSYIGLGVSSLPATNIGSKSMTLNGKLKGLGNYAGAECSFQYYPVDQYKNYALKFDGVDDRISFNKAIIPTDGGPWTISFMAKIDSLSTGQSSVISQYALGSDNRFSIHANFDSGYWSIVQEPALGVVDIAPIVLGEVAYITVSYDGEKLKCYKNDICVTTVEISNLEILDLPTLIGNRDRTGYNDTFNGIIDELSVWSRALSKEEIEEHLHQELTGAEEGLIAYYRFNEGEGDILHDCSRNYNDGIIHGAQWVDSPFKLMPPKEKLEIVEGTEEEKVLIPTPLQETPPQKIYSPYTLVKTVTSKEVNGLYFDGVDDRVTIPHNALLKPTRITLMAWVEKDDWADNDINGSRIISCTQTGGYALQVSRDSGLVGILAYIGGAYRTAYAPKPASGKHFICSTYDGEYLRTYIDGELAKETAYSGSISYSVDNAVMIGAEPDSGSNAQEGYYFKGKISNVSIWNRAITAEEVKYYYENGLKGNEHGLVAYYKMDEGEGNKIYNSSLYKDEYNLDGTINGATWDVISLPKIKYEYQPGVKFSSTVVPGEYIPINVKGLSFDGVDDYVMVPYTSKLTPTRISIMAAVIIDNWAAIDAGEIVSKQHTGGYVVYVGSSQGIRFRLYISGGYRDLHAPQNELSPGLHFLCCTYDGSYMRIYIDGELAAEMAQTGDIQYSYNNALMIGCDAGQSSSPDSSAWLKGKVGNISIWNRGLTEEEVKLLYNKELKGNEQGLVAYYKDVFHGKLIDATSNWLDGTIYGATEVDNISVYSLDKEPSNIRYYYRAVAKGLPDYALSFDGENDHILLGTGVNLFNIVNEFTLFSLFALTSEEDVFHMFGLGYQSNPVTASYNSGIMLSVEPSNINIGVGQNYIRDSTTMTDCPINLNIGVPYHLVITRKQNILKIFIDSNLVYERNNLRPGDVYWNSRAFRIAAESNQISDDLRFFSPGIIYECGIFNRMLSNEEVKSLYTKKLVGNEPGLTGYYRIVEGEGNVLVDHSPNGKHGTIYGATWVQL